jgi:hypothetical protein
MLANPDEKFENPGAEQEKEKPSIFASIYRG